MESLHADIGEAGACAELPLAPRAARDAGGRRSTPVARPAEMEATTEYSGAHRRVITERTANVGLNVDTATKLFTVVDLSSVWVVGALYERDFSRVHVGSAAPSTASAYPGAACCRADVSYIDRR
jgi:hypothetical protein